jgi:hypothetical protein
MDRKTATQAAAAAHPKSRKVNVCSACLTASCWHGTFPCDSHKQAGLVERTVAELDAMGREHPSHYSVEKVREVCGAVAVAGYLPDKARPDGSIEGSPSLDDPELVREQARHDSQGHLRALLGGLPPTLRHLYTTDNIVHSLITLAAVKGHTERQLLLDLTVHLAEALRGATRVHTEHLMRCLGPGYHGPGGSVQSSPTGPPFVEGRGGGEPES